ncbi:MAG: hypothetical protein AUG87_09485 [Candidatus Rokubacteria bacterium 13_1_20CM_4_70_14]|nr:MAG: hypothetical protein AUI18_02735 [Candidatus Rokubacteria bacterium 13_1_40CM_2_70_45]OLD76294.1 MAG: hypothetical protein AUG87_09485 [Candidatus Rokubacteria bacterium 13_1_20CM_4_70_14]
MDTARSLRTRDGAVIGYRLWRPGAPRRTLVLLHGLGSNLTRWSEFVANTSLRADWDILRPDLRGHGGSLDRGRIGMDEWCADLAAVLEAERAPRAVVAGHCLGANIAVEFARRDPGAVVGLVLIEPMLRDALRGSLSATARLRPLSVPVVWLVRALNALGIHRRRVAPLDLVELDRGTRAAMSQGGSGTIARRHAAPWVDLATTPTAVYLQSLMAVNRGVADLEAIRVPVLALLSTGGALSDPVLTERRLRALPNCRVLRLAAEHWIPTEQPEAMRNAIEEWCTELATAARP